MSVSVLLKSRILPDAPRIQNLNNDSSMDWSVRAFGFDVSGGRECLFLAESSCPSSAYECLLWRKG